MKCLCEHKHVVPLPPFFMNEIHTLSGWCQQKDPPSPMREKPHDEKQQTRSLLTSPLCLSVCISLHRPPISTSTPFLRPCFTRRMSNPTKEGRGEANTPSAYRSASAPYQWRRTARRGCIWKPPRLGSIKPGLDKSWHDPSTGTVARTENVDYAL